MTNLKLTLRNLLKSKTVTLLNILGLTVGLTVSMLIFLFITNQYSVDKFIPDIDNVYCLTNNGETYFSQNEINLIKDNVPDIDKITYCSEDWSPQVFLKKGEESFKTEKMLTADSCFFRVFSFEAIYGDPLNAFNSSDKIVLTQSFSQKIFGNINPVGKTLIYNSTYLQNELLEVAAVIEDFPSTSSWDFEAVLSFETNYKIDWYVKNMQNWGTRNYKAFIKINKNLKQEQASAKLNNIAMDKVPDWIKENFKLGLFPFTDVYFDLPEMSLTKHGNRLTVSIIGITGILILLLACINYVNMVTAQREKRNKNVGIVKILGGNRHKIVRLITAESLIQVVVSAIISMILIKLAIPVFKSLTSINLEYSEIFSIQNILMLLLVFLLMVAITGIIPGVIFSRKVPLLLVKQSNVKGSNISRNSLLVFQFTVTIALLASIFIVNKQNSYINNKDLGFKMNSIVYANTNDDLEENAEAFNNEIRKITGISDFTYAQNVLVDNSQNWGKDIINKGEKMDINFSKLSVAPNFFSFFEIKQKEGRVFNENSKKRREFIFNATAQKQYNLTNINDAIVSYTDPDDGKIVGVVDDYNFESLHVPIRAAGFMCSGNFDEVLYLKLNTLKSGEHTKIMQQLESVWNKFSPNFPLEYQYLDKKWEAKYVKDQNFRKIIFYTTLISIFLSCIGLIGLTFFIMEQRTKEIGIRKVNGAKTSELMTMLHKNFIKWIAIAFVIATPIAYYAMNLWLEDFAYKIEISWWIFALAGVSALIIALITVSWQSWRAATKNPVEVLKCE